MHPNDPSFPKAKVVRSNRQRPPSRMGADTRISDRWTDISWRIVRQTGRFLPYFPGSGKEGCATLAAMRRRATVRGRSARIAIQAAFVIASAFAVLACSDNEYPMGGSACRFDPRYCGGGLGASCRGDVECFGGGFCCRDKHCGGGMCTLSCNADVQCPPDMGCEHNVCMFVCRSDLDCAIGQRCEHGHTVCEWP